MRYSVIALTYNQLAVTRRCLTALVRDTVSDAPWELLVVDNGSSDDTPRWVADELGPFGSARGVPVRLLRNAENVGCSLARNQGIAAATGDFLVFNDNDVTPRTRAWLPRLREAIESAPDVGLAGPKLVYPTPGAAIQCAGVGISRRGHVCFRGRGQPNDAPAWAIAAEVQCLISACLMVSADLPRRFGGFDPIFHPVQFEDFDLCYRLREAGWRAIYTPAAEMYHFESTTTQGSPARNNAATVVRNGLTFQKRWRHLFEAEDGPSEAACRWLRLPPLPPLEAIPDPLPMVEPVTSMQTDASPFC
jgi:O-antigen biosynthesis protein